MAATSSNTPEPLIDMTEVGVPSSHDPRVTVASGINWKVCRGEYWAVGGLQGAGKTDFLLMAGGLTAPRSGSYRLFGLPMPIFEGESLKERLRVGFVFETGQLFNHLTIEQNVALPLRYHQNLTPEAARAQTLELLDLLELGPFASSTPGSIGRNWQKRAGLARALMLRPELLLLDNPLTGLDLKHSNWWLNFLDQLSSGHPWLRHQPMTLVVTVSDLRPWKGRAGRFAVLHDKQLTPLGTWNDLTVTPERMVNDLLNADTPEI